MHTVRFFDHIAPRYNLTNHILSLGIDIYWMRKFVTRIAHHAPRSVLDICTGTGDVALGLAHALPRSLIVGVDASRGMLTIAQEREKKRTHTAADAHTAGARAIRFIQADALHVPYHDHEFECVTMAFGLRNIHDYSAALNECARLLQRHGHVYILEFSLPKNHVLKFFYLLYLKYYIPFIGWVFGNAPAYAYLASSIQEFSRSVNVPQLLSRAGFSAISTHPLTFGIATIYHASYN